MKAIRIVPAALALAFAIGVSMPHAAFAGESDTDDDSGGSTLGINLATAGSTPQEIHQFLAGLRPDTRAQVIGGCQTYVASPADAPDTVVAWCQQALAS